MFNKIDKKKMLNYSFIIISTFVLFYILFANNELKQLIDVLKSINLKYIIMAILSIFVFWFIESYMIYIFIEKYTNKKKNFKTFWLAIKTTMIGQYYSNITPFASGGQPVQLYIMKEEDVPLSSATAVLVSKFLLFQVGVTFYSLILAFYKIKMLLSYSNEISIFIFAGLMINSIMISTVILIAFKPKLIKVLTENIFKILYKHHIIKDMHSSVQKTNCFISEYETSINKLKNDIFLTLKLFLFTFIQLTAFFSITFFVYKSLNLSGSNIVEIICLQSFLYMAVSFIPIPGTAGVSEIGFLLLLGHVFSSNVIGTALILWRGISYYFSLLFSGLFSLLVTSLKKKKSIA